MKRSLPIVLILALLAQTFNQAFYCLDYAINTAAYERYCENKALPMLHCNGKCQLMKRLQEQERNQPKPPELKHAEKIECISNEEFFTPQLTVAYHRQSRPRYVSPTAVGARTKIFHPPNFA